MKILLVEDDFLTRKLMQIYLKEYGICDMANDGLEAVEAVKISINEDDRYDFICLDILMPELNGQDALKQIRDEESKAKVKNSKIVMTTGLDDSKNIIKAFHEQCDGYLVKPVTPENLKLKIEELNLIK